MKKIYALAMAAMTLPAFAVTPVGNMTSAQAVLGQPGKLAIEAKNDMKKAPARIKSMDDAYGPYQIKYSWGLSGDDQFKGNIAPMMIAGEAANEVILKNCPYSDMDIVATIDVTAGTMTVKKQDLLYNPTEGEMMVFQPEWIDEEKGEPVSVESIVGTFDADGNITWPERACWSIRISKGWFCLLYQMNWRKIHYFDFTPGDAGYEEACDITFEDNVINMFVAEEYKVGAQTAKAYKSTDGSQYVIANPYNSTKWAELNAGAQIGLNNDGCFYLNLMNAECAMLRPATGCGMWINSADQGEEPYYQEVFPFNQEGQTFYLKEWPVEDIIDDFYANEIPLSTADLEKGEVNIINMFFGFTDDPLMTYWFGPENPMSYKFTGFNFSGVNEVNVENNAPVKYYNLQGMEVVNPAKGQLVIKTQGNKTVKEIVK